MKNFLTQMGLWKKKPKIIDVLDFLPPGYILRKNWKLNALIKKTSSFSR